jgi:hypothetical protein
MREGVSVSFGLGLQSNISEVVSGENVDREFPS